MIVFRNVITTDGIMRKPTFITGKDTAIDGGSGKWALVDPDTGNQIESFELPDEFTGDEEKLEKIVNDCYEMVVKHDDSFPTNAINYCLRHAGINAADLNSVVFYEKPFVKFERLLETYLAFAPKGFASFSKAMPLWVKDKLFQKANIVKLLTLSVSGDLDWEAKLLFSEHHLSHAASAFYPSPFETAAPAYACATASNDPSPDFGPYGPNELFCP